MERALRKDRHRLEPDNVFRAPGRVNFSGGNHRRHAAMQAAVDPAQLILSRRPIATYRVYVAIDQSRSQSRAFRIDRCCCARDVEIFGFTNSLNHSVDRDDCVGIEDRLIKISAEQEPDIADDKFAGSGFYR